MLPLNLTPFPILTTERLILRQLDLVDEEEIFFLRSDEKNNEFIDRPKADSLEDARKFILEIKSSTEINEAVYWAITFKNDNRLLGTICYWNISEEESRAEIGLELLPEFHGRGIMHEAFTKVIEFGFEVMKLKAIVAFTHMYNEAALKILEKNGFIRNMEAEITGSAMVNMVVYSLANSAET